MAIPQLSKAVWSRLHCDYSWEVFVRNCYFNLSTIFSSLWQKRAGQYILFLKTSYTWENCCHVSSQAFFFFSIEYSSCYSFSHRLCFLVLLSSLLLSAVLSPIVLPFHQASCVKLDIALMLGFSRGLNDQNIL